MWKQSELIFPAFTYISFLIQFFCFNLCYVLHILLTEAMGIKALILVS